MGDEALRGEMRATLDAALQDPMPLAEPTAEQRAEWAEKRHMFWRNRCLEHARTIDRQQQRIHDLIANHADAERYRRLRDKGLGVVPMARVLIMYRGQYIACRQEELDAAVDSL